MALHRVFDSPHDRILWDTGHQAYVHKIVTGRAGGFDRLRQKGGLSGYPSRAESDHDIIENSHASTALSYADGLAKAFQLRGETDRHVVAVVGDGSLTGGMAWEALNNIAADRSRCLVIVVNDNERSYSPTVGGLAHHLSTLRTTRATRGSCVGQAGPRSYAGRGSADLRDPARPEEGPQGRRRPAGHVRGPRAEVRRADRRARRRGGRARAAAGPRLRRPGHRALPDPQGPRLQARRGRRGRPLPRHRRHRPRDRSAARGPRHRVDQGLLRGAGHDRR